MSLSFHKSRKRPRLGNKNSGKCGEITFCMQVGIRVYALKCLFCPQISLEWEDFINHIEDEHDEELRSDNLLQHEAEEANIDANSSKESVPRHSSASIMAELPNAGPIRVRNEFYDNASADALLDSDDPLVGNAEIRPKVENFNSYEIRVFNEARMDQTCDSVDEQKPFDSMHSPSETDSDMEATNSQPNLSFQPDRLPPAMTNMSFFGNVELPLPSAQEIRLIPELQTIIRIKILENKHRTKLAKGLISYILNKQPERRISRQDFFTLSESIVEIFPCELKETYYVPHTTGQRAKGKLFDAYNNTRTRFSVAGLINRGFKSKSEENTSLAKANTWENDVPADINESDLSILKSGCSKWDLVLAIWKKTLSYRQRELRNSNLKPHEYIEKYKVLVHEKSYELFDMDFKMLYPSAKTIYNWKLYYPKIIARAEKLKDTTVREILTYINNAEEEDSKLALSFMLITYVLPNPKQKMTKLETLECFISYCKDITDADEEMKNQIKLEEQPKVYLVGDSSKTISQAFVDICGTRLKFENPIKAIEVCFYCFMIMNIKYHKNVAHIWIFIQKLIYEVNTPLDVVLPAINTIINDLRLDKFY